MSELVSGMLELVKLVELVVVTDVRLLQLDEPLRWLSRVLEEAEVLRFRLAGCRLDKNFLRLDFGLLLEPPTLAENFSNLASNSGLFKMD